MDVSLVHMQISKIKGEGIEPHKQTSVNLQSSRRRLFLTIVILPTGGEKVFFR